MARIVDYEKRINQGDLKEFFVLILQGDLEIIQSKETGILYATTRKVNMPSTLNKQACKAMLGRDLPGEIRKVSCENYDYTVQETDEIMRLDYRYGYGQEKKRQLLNLEELIMYLPTLKLFQRMEFQNWSINHKACLS